MRSFFDSSSQNPRTFWLLIQDICCLSSGSEEQIKTRKFLCRIFELVFGRPVLLFAYVVEGFKNGMCNYERPWYGWNGGGSPRGVFKHDLLLTSPSPTSFCGLHRDLRTSCAAWSTCCLLKGKGTQLDSLILMTYVGPIVPTKAAVHLPFWKRAVLTVKKKSFRYALQQLLPRRRAALIFPSENENPDWAAIGANCNNQ